MITTPNSLSASIKEQVTKRINKVWRIKWNVEAWNTSATLQLGLLKPKMWGAGQRRMKFNHWLTFDQWFNNWSPRARWRSHKASNFDSCLEVGLATKVQEGTLGLTWQRAKEDFGRRWVNGSITKEVWKHYGWRGERKLKLEKLWLSIGWEFRSRNWRG